METFNVQTKSSELYPLIECDQGFELNFTCTGENSFSSHGNISSFEWTVNGKKITGKSVTFSLNEGESLDVSLKIKNNDNESIGNYVVEDIKYIPFRSSGVAQIVSPRLNSFVPKNSTLSLDLTEFNLNDSEDSLIGDVEVLLNGLELDINSFSIINNLFENNVMFIEGRNVLTIRITEKDSRVYEESFYFYSGERALVFKELSGLSCDKKINIFDLESNVSLAELSFSSSVVSVNNFPSNIELYGFAECFVDGELYTTTFYIPLDANEVEFSLDKNIANNNIENLDFSKGLVGWKISKGDYSFVSHPNSLGEQERYIRLLSNNGESLIKTQFIFDSKYNSVRFRFRGRFNQSEVGVLILRNESTGELTATSLNKFNTSDNNDSHLIDFDNVLKDGVKYSASYYTRKSVEDEVLGEQFTFNLFSLISYVYANDSAEEANDMASKAKKIKAVAFSCKSLSNSSCTSELSTITLFGFDPDSKMKKNEKRINRLSVGIQGELSEEEKSKISQYQFIVSSPGKEDYILGRREKLDSNGRMFIDFEEKSEYEKVNKVGLSLRAVDESGSPVFSESVVPRFRVGSSKNEGIYAKISEFYTTTSILVNNPNFKTERYGKLRECDFGCDSYVLTKNKKNFTDILRKKIVIDEKEYVFKFNDLQVMNASSFRSVGSHNSGLDIDVQVFELLDGKTLDSPVPIDSETMVKVIDDLASDSKIRFIFSMMPKYGDRLMASCSNGVANEGFIRAKTPGHSDHLHIRVSNPEISYALSRFSQTLEEQTSFSNEIDSMTFERDSTTYYKFRNNSSEKKIPLKYFNSEDLTEVLLTEPEYAEVNEEIDLKFVFKKHKKGGVACQIRSQIEFTEDAISFDPSTNKFFKVKKTRMFKSKLLKSNKANHTFCTSSGTNWQYEFSKVNKVATGGLAPQGGEIKLYDYYKNPDELISTHSISMLHYKDLDGAIRWVGNVNPAIVNYFQYNDMYNVEGRVGSPSECLQYGRKFLIFDQNRSTDSNAKISIYFE